MKSENKLSIFIDESGDFGPFCKHCPFYIFTMVFHEQHNNLSSQFEMFKNELIKLDFKKPYFHAGPIIRNEYEYKKISKDNRKRSFKKMQIFLKKLKVCFKSIFVEKKDLSTEIDLVLSLQKKLVNFIKDNLLYFQEFSSIKIYYDNGQTQLSKILKHNFEIFFPNIEENFDANPNDYCLFQIADYLSTTKLVYEKYEKGNATAIEKEFFGSEKKFFKKNFLDDIEKKILKSK